MSVFAHRGASELATLRDPNRYPHGVRARYNVGCRCDDCRKANREYERERLKRQRTSPNRLVDATEVRKHLEKLTAAGVGLRAVADACDVSRSILGGIRRGEQRFIRAQSAERVLQVDEQAISDGSLVPAAETWKLLEELIEEGYRSYDLARRLGSTARIPHLAVSKRMVTAATALRVKRLHAQLMAECDDAVPVVEERVTPRARILKAIRHYEWISAFDLFEALDVPEDERNAYSVAIGRLARDGKIRRRRFGMEMPEYAPISGAA